jgi:hypothetical protein
MNRTQIIEQAFALVRLVAGFAERGRQFFYSVVLHCHACPRCGGSLHMEHEALARCRGCGNRFDPTTTFQRCPACGGLPRLRVRRYECASCGAEIASRFLFDGLVFDADYFRQKMAEHRERKRERRERVRRMLAESRSNAVLPGPAVLNAVPGLAEALNSLTSGQDVPFNWRPSSSCDLTRYQRHIQAHIQPFALPLDEIPPLGEDARVDRIWRFVAIVFLAHAGLITIWQDGPEVMVIQRETDGEGQDISGDLEDLDGVEGPLGRVEA